MNQDTIMDNNRTDNYFKVDSGASQVYKIQKI
ncbi:hypothetical protein ES705_11095 [subsurface metagenome]